MRTPVEVAVYRRTGIPSLEEAFMETEKMSTPVTQRLLAERDDLNRRLVAVNAQLEELAAAERDDLRHRLSALESRVQLLAATIGPAPAPALAQQPPVDGPIPAAEPEAVPVPVHPDQERPPVPLAPPPAAAPAPSRPPLVAECVSMGDLALQSSAAADAKFLGWVPAGTRLFLTGAAAGGRSEIAYYDGTAWVESGGLARVPRSPGPTPVSARQAASAPSQPPAPTSRPARAPVWARPGFVPRLLALAGAAVTLTGIALLLVLAAQYGFFGPEARTASAAGLAIVLIGLAFIVRRRDPRNVGAPILAATGVAAAFLSVVAATVSYGWLPPILGILLTAAIGVGGLVLARLWANQWVGLMCVLGSLVLTPFIGATDPVVTAAFMVALTAVTLGVERGTDWRLFPFARVLPTSLTLLALSLGASPVPSGQVAFLIGLTVALALLGLGSALAAPAEPPIGQAIAAGLMIPMALPAALSPNLLSHPVTAASVLATMAVVFGIPGFLPVVHPRVRWAAVPIGAGFTLIAALTATEQRYLGFLTLGLAAAYLAVAAQSRSAVNLFVGAVLAAIGIAEWLPLLAHFLDESAAVTAGPEQIAQSLVGITVVVLAGRAARRWVGLLRPWMIYLRWSLATAMGSMALVHLGTWLGVQAGNPSAGFQTGQAIVTSAWMVLCVGFLQRGLTATQEVADVWLHLALALAALAVAKLFLLDLGMLDAIARVGAFLVVGLLLLFVGTRYARAWERVHGGKPAPVGPTPPEAPRQPPPTGPAST